MTGIELPRDRKGRFTEKNPRIKKVAFYLLLIAGVFSIVNFGLERYVDFRSKYDIRKPIVFNYELYTQSVVYELPEKLELRPVVEVIEQSDIQINDPVDQAIMDLWGDRYFLLARSIFKCESGLRPDAVGWTSKDIGIAQINWPTWESKIKEKYGYTLVDMFDPAKNLEVAYWIWDRADGTEDDGKGSFEPWVVYQNGTFVGCVD